MMTCRILIVEDDPVMATSLTDSLKRELGEVEVIVVSDFEKAPSEIACAMPDVVVLDIFDEQIEQPAKDAVMPAWLVVWNEHFCPVVFHSAQEDEEYKNLNHPFVRYEIKASGSHGRVVNHIKSFAPQIEGLRAVRHELSRSAGEALRHAGPIVWQSGGSAAEKQDTLLRVVRRRMAAALDYTAEHGIVLQAWEQYIYPPIGDDLLTGDLIRAMDGDQNDPEVFYLVLSPSCDLVLGRGSKTLEQVLVAGCGPVSDFVAKTNIDLQKHPERLPSELTKDQVAGLTVLPMFSSVIPLMAANLKKLSLIPYADIATKTGETKAYTRVASVDSPFRERLAWAYLQVGGRPGVPDVDVKALAEAIGLAMTPKGHAMKAKGSA